MMAFLDLAEALEGLGYANRWQDQVEKVGARYNAYQVWYQREVRGPRRKAQRAAAARLLPSPPPPTWTHKQRLDHERYLRRKAAGNGPKRKYFK